jgi:D-3-phosphoglycerate dehydrogenase
MKQIKLLNKIAKAGTSRFDPAAYEVSAEVSDPDGIMVRSAAMHDMEFSPNLKAIARCGAGVNNIPVDACAEKGIVVFNTPGANANGVKELAIAALLLASRNIIGGVEWANSLLADGAVPGGIAKAVEAGKSAYGGVELKGKTLGVIGLGAIGGLVANAAKALGMDVIGCDPYLTVDAAWGLSSSVRHATSYEEVYAVSDYITLHVPATKETKGMICAASIAQMKKGVRIVNLSRADLVNAEELKDAIKDGSVAAYVTDFPTEEVVNVPGIVAIPHLGASTEESEENCAAMAADELKDFLENGTIRNSVNYPAVDMPRTDAGRLVILHKNIPNMISHISSTLAERQINIENFADRSRGEYAVCLMDTYAEINPEIVSGIEAMDGIIRVIVL